jgi:hypothetical protein
MDPLLAMGVLVFVLGIIGLIVLYKGRKKKT